MKLSYEVFPPKPWDGIEKIYECLSAFAEHDVEFISVTCGAARSADGLTTEVCSCIRNRYGKRAVAHITCSGTPESGPEAGLRALRDAGISDVLALRGDSTGESRPSEFRHATDLMKRINAFGGFNVMAACYPEGHKESGSIYEDYTALKEKYALGARTFVSQLFFDNADFLRMAERISGLGPDVEARAGVMPALSARSISRMVSLSGARLTREMRALLEKYGENDREMNRAGTEYAIRQIRDLAERGCERAHLYTMCKVRETNAIYDGIKDLLD